MGCSPVRLFHVRQAGLARRLIDVAQRDDARLWESQVLVKMSRAAASQADDTHLHTVIRAHDARGGRRVGCTLKETPACDF